MISTEQNQLEHAAAKQNMANVLAHPNLLEDKEHDFKLNAKNHVPPQQSELDALLNTYQQGLLAQAKQQAQNLSKKSAKHVLAWKILGIIYQQEMAVEDAVFALNKAVELAPKDAEVHYNLGNFYYDQQLLKQAQAAYLKAVKLAPNFVQAVFNLACVLKDLGLHAQAEKQFKHGIKLDTSHAVMYFHLAEVIAKQQRLKEAMPFYKKSLELNPQDAETMLKLGVAYLTLNHIDDAIEILNVLLQLDADNASAHNALGLAHQVHKQYEVAEQHFTAAIALRADYVAPYKNLGLLYKEMGKGDEAVTCYRQALNLETPSAETINNLAVLNIDQGHYAEAEALCRKALELNPQYGDSWNNLGLVLQARMYHKEAEAAFEQALKYQPNDVATLMNYGVTLNSLGKLTSAEAILKKGIKLDSKNTGCYVNLSNTYLDQSNIDAAINNSKKALELEPTHLLAHDNLLFAMEYSNQYNAATRLAAAHEYGRAITAQARPYQTWLATAQTQRLRVGIVSGDLRQHPVAYFLKNAIKDLDYSQIDLFAYTPDGRTDATTLELKPYFSGWKSLAGLKDADAAAVIHQDGIHILLDLSGHSAGNRLPMFAWKPAPVQASWLGYWATTGLPAIDYVLADEIGVPAANQAQFTESVKYLAHTRMCFTPPDTSLAVSPLPAISNGYITFASFQNMAKISDEVIELWVAVMQAVPNSQLRWQSKTFIDATVIQATQARFAKFGLDPKRLVFHGKVSRDEYLAAHAEVDLILDSFPFTGGTTTCEALWMGVPTLTLAGDTMIARQGASLLTAAGLSDWVVESKQDFMQQACSVCADLNALANLRSHLREKVQSSALFDSTLFAKSLQAVLWQMWQEKLQHLVESHSLVTELASKVSDAQATKIQLVSATRMTEQVFWEKSALGLSLKRHMQQNSNLQVSIAYENTRGLSTIFNESIASADEDTTLVFIHDDVWIDETNFADAVLAGLQQFDVIGVAGNKGRLPRQPAWAFIDVNFTWDKPENLSGSVAHGAHAYGEVSNYGPVPAACELMDGVFLAAKKSTLLSKQVQFDEQFDFHFYDLDFCRSARNANLTLGTWSIKLTHQSGGAFGSAQWQAKYQLYLKKWENMDTNLAADDFSDALNEVYQQAVQHQEAGEIDQAIALYMEILQVQPQHAEANHNLGFIEAHTQSVDAALPRFETAVMAKPQSEQFWVSYIDALMQVGAAETAALAIEQGQKYGLKAETAQMLATEFAQQLAQADTKAMASDYTITTIVPAYKAAYMGDLLLSLASQTYKQFKVIISDDSPDNAVTKRVTELRKQGLASNIAITVVEGPKQGSMANIVHLLNMWNASTPLLHVLCDDDMIYPLFYQKHLAAHQQQALSTSVSYRWISNEAGFPIENPQIPAFVNKTQTSNVVLDAADLFNSTIPYCFNWLGEVSNCVFSRDIALQLKDQSMAGIVYNGLGDIGLILQGALQGKTAIIKEHLGAFRLSPHQNTGNLNSISFQCGYVAWIALALSAYQLQQINLQQAQQCISAINQTLLNRFAEVPTLLAIAQLPQHYKLADEDYKIAFTRLWNELLAQDKSWMTAIKIKQEVLVEA